jgi:hypothetical protein
MVNKSCFTLASDLGGFLAPSPRRRRREEFPFAPPAGTDSKPGPRRRCVVTPVEPGGRTALDGVLNMAVNED